MLRAFFAQFRDKIRKFNLTTAGATSIGAAVVYPLLIFLGDVNIAQSVENIKYIWSETTKWPTSPQDKFNERKSNQVVCTDLRTLRDAVADIKGPHYEAKNAAFNELLGGKRICNAGWPVTIDYILPQEKNGKTSVIVRDNVQPDLKLHLRSNSALRRYKSGDGVWVTGYLSDFNTREIISVDFAKLRPRTIRRPIAKRTNQANNENNPGASPQKVNFLSFLDRLFSPPAH